MNAKAVLVLCASALFIQSALGNCCGRRPSGCGCGGLGYGGYGAGIADVGIAGGLSASYGGGLGVASASCAAPVGLALESENAYEGCVDVCGNLPFLGTTRVEGVFPTKGAGAIRYGCGDGAVGITAEGGYGASGLGYGASGLGYGGYGLGGCGCGCRRGCAY